MAKTDIRIDIKNDLRPAYYDDFHCLAEGCKISCCKGWTITFSKRDYLTLRRQEGSAELNALLKSGLRRIRKGQTSEITYGEFNMDSGVCPLLGEDGLCRLQREKGHAVLPNVCRAYPRTELHMASGYLERSLCPSCEGVLALLWDLPEGIGFRSDPLPKEERRTFPMKKDNSLSLGFPAVREWCIDVLQNRRFPLAQRIFLMGLGLKDLADGGEDINRWAERAAVLPDSVDVASILPTGDQELSMFLSSCVHTLLKIRPSEAESEAVIIDLLKGIKPMPHGDMKSLSVPLAPYLAARARFERQSDGRGLFMENLMTAIFFHLRMPHINSREDLWKSYVNFCSLYAFYRLLSVMSCREGASGDRDELFRLIVFAGRNLIHNGQRQNRLRDEFFKNDSATLAHMAILLCG